MLASYVFASSLALISLVHPVLGHGYVKTVTVDGKEYPAWDPNTDPYESPVPSRVVRKIPNDGPVTDVSSIHLACNNGGEAAQKISATVKAGGKVEFQWTNWLNDHHGPVSVYMASCGGKCSALDLTKSGDGLDWFKVDAKGYDSAKKTWASDDLIAAGSKWTTTVPSQLAAGEYLMRHEIIALHSLPAQMYPMCLQLTVTGSGSLRATGSETTSIPGLYDDFKFPDIWSDNFKSFTIPGPAVFGSGSSAGGSGDDSSSAAPSSTKSAVSSSTPSSTVSASSDTPEPTTRAPPSSTQVVVVVSSTASTASATSSAPTATSTGQCKRRTRRAVRSVPESTVARRAHHAGFQRRSHGHH